MSMYTAGLFTAITSGVLLALPFAAGAETVERFEAELTVHEDATLSVREEIAYDFGTEERHGIFRVVPYRYRTQLGNFTADINVRSVTNPSGTPYQFETSRESGALRIRIGDPDATVSGVQTYVIEYDVTGPFLYFNEYDELYWNVTGNEWEVPIEAVHGTVTLPENAAVVQSSCYRGAEGSTDRCTESAVSEDGADADFVFSDSALAPNEGVTIAVAFPKGVIHEPTRSERFFGFVSDNWPVGVPVLALIGCMYLWYTRGRDPQGRSAIVPMYEPPEGMSPAEVGVVYDEYVQMKDIAAEIIHLAVQGYLKIHQAEEKKLFGFTSTDYILEKKKEGSDLKKEYDRDLLNELFAAGNIGTHDVHGVTIEGVALSELKNKFATEATKLKGALYRATVQGGSFLKGPQSVRTWYAIAGVLLGVLGFALGIIFFQTLIAIISFALSGIILALFAFIMPVRTKNGVLKYEHILGFRDYVHTAERDRLAFHNAPERTPERFDALLPYAMVLGVEKEWAKQFAGIDREPPSWYGAPAGYVFAADTFTSDIGNFSSATASAAAPASSGSAGGGSSGGGFGGGGGGSW